jgi:hypothetical protein
MCGDPLYYYVRDKGSAVAHHWDYLRSRTDYALCGHPYQAPVWEGEDRPRAVCRACQELLPPHEARWWRTKAEALQAELESLRLDTEALRTRVAELERHVDNQRSQLRHLNAKRGAGDRASVADNRASGVSRTKPRAKSSGKRKGQKKGKPDNTREAVTRRLREAPGPLSAADISTGWRRPSAGPVRVVRGGLPSLGKRR